MCSFNKAVLIIKSPITLDNPKQRDIPKVAPAIFEISSFF
jgi:hypothetical protein